MHDQANRGGEGIAGVLVSLSWLPFAEVIREAIGGKKEYAKLDDADAIDNAKLFVCSDASGKMQVEEIGEDFTQGDLIPEDVMILDGGAIVYVWLGKKANANERKDGPE